MPLYRLKEFYKNYREAFGGDDVKALDLYTSGEQKIGSVDEVLVDSDGQFRYLIIDMKALGAGKKILLPIGLTRIDYNAGRVYTDGMSKDRVEQLPEYKDGVAIDHDYEHQVRVVYHPASQPAGKSGANLYEQQPDIYQVSERKHGELKAYEDQLRATHSR
jgi:hypothetical protein